VEKFEQTRHRIKLVTKFSPRVIYFLASAEIIYLILAYPKSTKDSLTPAEKITLKALTHQLKGEFSK